jgi:protein phosphatase
MLICSDGLTNMLGDDEIQGIIMGHTGRLNEMVNALTDAANKKGGKDNISVIAVEIEG